MAEAGKVYWITGLPGAGKTTVGALVFQRIRRTHPNSVLLDGDSLRQVFQGMGGYDREARLAYASSYGRLCRMLSGQGIHVVCCTVSMFDSVRAWNREHIPGYCEIFLDVPMEVLRRRDQKGLYSRAARGEEKNVVGMDQAMELPKHPDVHVVNDGAEPPERVAERIWQAAAGAI